MADVLTFERARRWEAPRPSGSPYKGKAVFFDRPELDQILQLYSRKVMAGEWRDYAIGGDGDGAVFAIYGHASPLPLFRIAKRPKSERRPACFEVSAGVQVLETEKSLGAILKAMERRTPRLVANTQQY